MPLVVTDMTPLLIIRAVTFAVLKPADETLNVKDCASGLL
jgi:hypothetical protein